LKKKREGAIPIKDRDRAEESGPTPFRGKEKKESDFACRLESKACRKKGHIPFFLLGGGEKGKRSPNPFTGRRRLKKGLTVSGLVEEGKRVPLGEKRAAFLEKE